MYGLQFPVKVVLKQVLDALGLHEWFEGTTEAGNLDALLLAIKLREKLSDYNRSFGNLLPNTYSSSSMFFPEHLSILSNFVYFIVLCLCSYNRC